MKRVTLMVKDGVIVHVFYPVFPPDANADEVVKAVLIGLASLWLPMVKGVLQGLQNFLGLGWVLILDGVGRFGAILAILWLGGQAAGGMTGALIGQGVSLLIGAWLIRHLLRARSRRA